MHLGRDRSLPVLHLVACRAWGRLFLKNGSDLRNSVELGPFTRGWGKMLAPVILLVMQADPRYLPGSFLESNDPVVCLVAHAFCDAFNLFKVPIIVLHLVSLQAELLAFLEHVLHRNASLTI